MTSGLIQNIRVGRGTNFPSEKLPWQGRDRGQPMAGSTAQDSVVIQPDLLWSLAASFRNPAWEGEVDLFTPEDHIDGLLWTSENKNYFSTRETFSLLTLLGGHAFKN